ncbi:MAG: bifunctional UDP-N-acetylglucosamine diphosphorylase/glucosamine-1-phosphate N-acetyltransferase GlmU [Thermoanaerobacteraceae bacterium]|nr:bifunctional UDP-N-acetylglucosamine diphosphorylase/glucosamine-1-phosphate N-acetyltransferase GlmU [Thermoanaerobacteraceae bacterium]
MSQITAIVLAAGKGTRMKSSKAKVLHSLAGKPMVEHVLDAVKKAGIEQQIVVVGHQAEEVKAHLGDGYTYVLQEKQLGTGHAVKQTTNAWPSHGRTLLILCGDTPLVTAETLEKLVSYHHHHEAVCTVLTAVVPDPTGYGRIIRNQQGHVTAIVEEKDATDAQKEIKEINTGCYCFDQNRLAEALEQLSPANAQGEYYLTDVISFFQQQGHVVAGVEVRDFRELQGINNRSQLAQAEAILRERINEALMLSGVTIVSPHNTYIDAGVQVGRDTVIMPNTHLRGNTKIGENCEIGPDTTIINSSVGSGTVINNSVIKESNIGNNCTIGPFSYLRPGTRLADNVKIGDFVEVKKSVIGKGSKIPHLTYIGDAEIEEQVNVGAGTITCNYDGKNKWKTVLKKGAFIGSNTNLVAPVTVGDNAVVGAGSTITKDVPADSLAVARERQRNILGWATKNKKET